MTSAIARLQPQTHTNTHYSQDKQMVYKPPMALSAPQTQVTLALFQKGSLPNRSWLPLRNKRGNMPGLLSSLDPAAQSQIKSLAHPSAASLWCPRPWHSDWWIITLRSFMGVLPETSARVVVQFEDAEEVQSYSTAQYRRQQTWLSHGRTSMFLLVISALMMQYLWGRITGSDVKGKQAAKKIKRG